ncbi:hypothetical protein LguiB_025389 [Lonicera macranthoides]
MAPGGRKRGAKGLKKTKKNELSLGDLVLAKVKGFPAWPAKISRPEDWQRTRDPKKYFVQFFGTAEIAFVAPADIQAFTTEVKNKLSARCKGKTVKYFAQAVEEICEAFEELQRRKSSGGTEDNDRPAFRPEAPVDVVVDDEVEVDLKDGIVKEELNGDTKIKGMGDHASGLECCSQIQDQLDGQDIKSSISCNAKDSLSSVVSRRSNRVPNDDANLLLMEQEEVSASSPCDYKTKDNVTCSTRLNAVQNGSISDAGGDSFSGMVFAQKNTSSSPLMTSFHVKHPKKELINGHKSKKVSTGTKKKSEFSSEEDKISTPAAFASLDEYNKIFKDKIRRKVASGGSRKESSLKSNGDAVVGNKAKQLLKDKIHLEVAGNNTHKDAKGGSKGQDPQVELSGRKMRPQLGKGKHNLVSNEVTHQVKRSKCEDVPNDADRDPLQRNGKSNLLHHKEGNAEIQRSISQKKMKNHLYSGVQKGSFDINFPGEEDVFPPTKRPCRSPISGSNLTSEEKKGKSPTISDKVISPVAQLHSKRQAVRLFDDNDEEARTPVHGGSTRRVDASSHVSDSTKKTCVCSESSLHDQLSERVSGQLEYGPSKGFLSSAKLLNDTLSTIPQRNVERPKKEMATPVSPSPWKLESEKISFKEDKPALVSPRSSPLLVAASKPVGELVKAAKSSSKVSGNVTQKKVQTGSNKGSIVGSDGLNQSQSQAANERSKPIFLGQRQKSTSSSISRLNDSTPVAGELLENDSIPDESRLEAGRNDKMSSLMDSKNADSVTSLKHLIEVAQAKRKQAHSQHGNSHGNPSSLLAPFGDVTGGSPITTFDVHPNLSHTSSSMMQLDIQGYHPRTSLASPSSHIHQFSLSNQPDIEEIDERRVSSGHFPAGGSLSGGTDAAVARDAFEGMIETLSRTKESIGRATRLAIDCAKYGIANEICAPLRKFVPTDTVCVYQKLALPTALPNPVTVLILKYSSCRWLETISNYIMVNFVQVKGQRMERIVQTLTVVVELLIQKLETEPSLHRRVDLFFLVDSITQCSHGHKGIAGASYIPTVEAALPRLLGAAAPPGTGAHENRRQCHKVLKLWIQRKILPESVLRRHMEDIGISNDDVPAGFFHRRSSRAERSIDDPVREMEGMLVDEYGSNAAFQLPGLLSSHVFEEEEEEEEDLRSMSCNVDGERSPLEMTPTARELETSNVTPNDRRHCILEDVDGELEMEDVSGNPKEESSFQNVSQQQASGEPASNIYTELSPLPEGSPPLPLGSPPPTPPMPSSPATPSLLTPPPPSPLPPPPPPVPSMQHPFVPTPPPLSLLPQPSLPPLPAIGSQHLHPFPSSLPSSPPKMSYQHHIPHDYSGAPIGNQLIQMAANNHAPHVGASVGIENFPQQCPCFVPGGVSNPQSSQPNHQFQPGNAPSTQNAFQPPLPALTPSGHFSYSNPRVQQYPQQQYPPPYSLPNHHDGSKRYVAEEQWRMPLNEFNAYGPCGVWLNGGRASSSSGPSFAQEGLFAHETFVYVYLVYELGFSAAGYFRPPPDMPPTSNVGYQPSAVIIFPSGASSAGHVVPRMMPCRPDMSSHMLLAVTQVGNDICSAAKEQRVDEN